MEEDVVGIDLTEAQDRLLKNASASTAIETGEEMDEVEKMLKEGRYRLCWLDIDTYWW